jgi:uncharacterized protein YneF (UPF0154 family)
MSFIIILSITLLIGLFIGFWAGYKFCKLENKDYKNEYNIYRSRKVN